MQKLVGAERKSRLAELIRSKVLAVSDNFEPVKMLDRVKETVFGSCGYVGKVVKETVADGCYFMLTLSNPIPRSSKKDVLFLDNKAPERLWENIG